MDTVENMVSFIVSNARLEHMYHTEDEIARIREVASGEKTCEQAVDEIISLHMKKYGCVRK